MNKKKVAIIGAGNVGTACIYALLQQNFIDEIVLINRHIDKALGEAQDLTDSIAFNPSNCEIYQGDYKDTKNAQIVVITIGVTKTADTSRLDCIKNNAAIIQPTIDKILDAGFNGIFIMVSNPVDLITYIVKKQSNFSRNKVIGTGTLIDSARLKMQMSKKLSINHQDIHTMIIGEHGDSQIPLWSQTNVSGKPILDLIKDGQLTWKELNLIADNVKDRGPHIFNLKHYTNWGIASSTVRLIYAIFNDERTILPVSTYLDGEYNLHDICISVPCVIGKNGVEEIFKMDLSLEEQNGLCKSAKLLKNVMQTNNLY